MPELLRDERKIMCLAPDQDLGVKAVERRRARIANAPNHSIMRLSLQGLLQAWIDVLV
jgi:hypothetical protein